MDGTIGTIMLFAGNFAPRGWAFCHGQTMAIAENQALFSILGTQYGGDGRQTFALPDYTKHAPGEKDDPPHYIICLVGMYPSRS